MRQQFVVRPLLSYSAPVDDDYMISIVDGPEAMRDDERRAALRQAFESLLSECFVSIERGRWFVYNQNPEKTTFRSFSPILVAL